MNKEASAIDFDVSNWKETFWNELNSTNLELREHLIGGYGNYSLFYSSLDTIQDMDGALHEFFSKNRNPSQLECLGFMQALVTLQNCVYVLSNIFNFPWSAKNNPELKRIRDIRDKVVGHPENSDHGEWSTSFFTSSNMNETGFYAVVQFKGQWENWLVNFLELARRNDKILGRQMSNIFPLVKRLKEQIEANKTKFI